MDEVVEMKKWILLYALTVAGVLLTAKLGSAGVTVMAENRPMERQHCVVIDPGHGGVDGGATSCTGNLESGFNLEISLRLNDLMNLLGYDTRMIRTSDISVYTEGKTIAQKKISDLRERVAMVEEQENPVLLSIHQNHFSDGRYAGPQVFYAEGSEALGESIQLALNTQLVPGNRRMAKKCRGVYLMEHISCPGVLIECGFLSNVREEARLRDPEYQKKLCAVVAAAVDQYLSNT